MLRDQLSSLATKFEGVEGVFQGRVTAISEALQQEYDAAHQDMLDAVAAAGQAQAAAEQEAAQAQAQVSGAAAVIICCCCHHSVIICCCCHHFVVAVFV